MTLSCLSFQRPRFKASRKDDYSNDRTNGSSSDQHREGGQRYRDHSQPRDDGYLDERRYRLSYSQDSDERHHHQYNSRNKQHYEDTHHDDKQRRGDTHRSDKQYREDIHHDDKRSREDTHRDDKRYRKDAHRDDKRHCDDHYRDHDSRLRRSDISYRDDKRARHSDDRKQHTRDTSSLGADPPWAEREYLYPEQTRVVLTNRGKINLKDQQPAIQRVLQKYIQVCIKKMVTEKALYKADERASAQRDLIIKTADSLGAADIAERLEVDRRFRSQMNAVGEGRLGTIRGDLKKMANGLVPSEYNLISGDVGPRVASLLTSCQWIYPGDADKMPNFKKPFERNIFAQLLATHFFNGADSIGSSVAMDFKSSVRDKPDEREIPEAMLGLVCATVALSISDWASGEYAGPQKYDATLAEEFYSDVMVEFSVMKESSMARYHRVMHGVYKRVCDMRRGKASVRVGSRGPSKMEIEE
ncbi:hypothetical protein NM688_g7285 [Phlebia brevispora]|uniref:Uncharacterized protein n=1 Tax=Phlebia brevispora TaxID=194682 RepID=A0ACC1S6X9_9APHY|nr:hypothetical protein NM688_g7285 [Phlebia brevispora]